jgi:hypothetical protein
MKKIFLRPKTACRERNGYCAHDCTLPIEAENINKLWLQKDNQAYLISQQYNNSKGNISV